MTSSCPAAALGLDRDRPAGCSSGKRVLDRVLHQLGEHEHQRGRDLGGDLAEACPSRRSSTRPAEPMTSASMTSSRSTTSSKSTSSSTDTDSVSCTSAIDCTRRIDSSSAARASGTATRRACSRSSAATVCRLFFTRWWISRIVASLLMICRSRRRSSVTSCISSSAPSVSPRGRSGSARNSTVAPPPSTSMLAGWPPSIAASTALGQVAGVERVVGDGAGQRVERLAEHGAGDAEPAERRQRVRAGVDDRAVRFEPHARRRRRAARSPPRRRRPASGNVPSATIAARSAALCR